MALNDEKMKDIKFKPKLENGKIDKKSLEKVTGGLKNMPVDTPKPISDDTRNKI